MVLFLRSKKGFRYIPENESEQPVLGWNKSDGIFIPAHIVPVQQLLEYETVSLLFITEQKSNFLHPVNLWLFILHWCLTPILSELFSSEDAFPICEFRGCIDVVKTQLEGIIGISFPLYHIFKDLDGAI